MTQKIKTFSLITGISVISIHLYNKLQYSLSVKKILDQSENNLYEWRFGNISYTKCGNGKPLLLVHDLSLGSSRYEFHKIIKALSKKYEVYAIDMLGYGLSDKPNMTYTCYLYVQLLTDFVKNRIGRKTDVIAVGDSASLAIMTCHNNPDVFNRLILINPQSLHRLNLMPNKRTHLLKLFVDLPVIGTFVYNLITSKFSFTNLFRKYYYSDKSKIEKKDIAAYVEASHLKDHNAKYSFSSHIGRYLNLNILHGLKEINHSIFIIAGQEKAATKSIVETYTNYNNSIEAVFIPGTKQYPHLEEPQKVLEQLNIFLD